MSQATKNFFLHNKKKLDDPIMKNFLQDAAHYNLLIEALNQPCKENKEKLDLAFKKHYKNAKMISYLSKLIHFFSIDIDKKVSQYRKRNILSVDCEDGIKNLNKGKIYQAEPWISSDKDLTYQEFQAAQNLKNSISNELLFDSLKILSEKQLKILELKYSNGLTNKEIASVLKESEQTISYNHSKALKKIKEFLS